MIGTKGNDHMNTLWKRRSLEAFHRGPSELTFHHDHVDVDGADGGLRQSLPFLQDPGYFTGWNPVIRLGPECHQLPNGDAYRKEDSRYMTVCSKLSFNLFRSR